jgi:hypothetical protein
LLADEIGDGTPQFPGFAEVTMEGVPQVIEVLDDQWAVPAVFGVDCGDLVAVADGG